MGPDPNFEVFDENIEIALKEIGGRIGASLPPGWAFNLVIASVGESGSTFYISNMAREDAMALLQELIDKQPRKGSI